MTGTEIAAHRLVNQQIVGTKHTSAKEIVGRLGAVQAQDYTMAKWAVGVRLPGSTEASIEQAIDAGDIIRTHILRPTWHFVSPDDIRWMLALSAPRIKGAITSLCRRLELDDTLFKKSNAIIAKALQGGKQLTRRELMAELEKSGIATDDMRASQVMMQAELDGVVCNGSRRGKQFTYALLDERVPQGASLTREEALAELTLRYFTSHGPATVQDFSWWSGLSVTDCRKGIESVASRLVQVAVEGTTYWFSDSNSSLLHTAKGIHFLPAFDEFLVAYKDRTASLDPLFAKEPITGNGIFKPVIVVDGKVVGIWKRRFRKDRALVAPQFFLPSSRVKEALLEDALIPFGAFLESGIEME